MLKQDKEILKSLLDQYGALEIVSSLAQFAKDKADEYSDLGLRKIAIDYVSVKDQLLNLKKILLNANI